MRKITNEAVEAFVSNKNYKKNGSDHYGNTSVIMEVSSDQFMNRMWLHGNLIAVKDHVNDVLKVSLCGWNTNTTRERLNGIPGVSVSTRKGQAFLNGNPIDDNKFYTI
jgi:hypothetical protein